MTAGLRASVIYAADSGRAGTPPLSPDSNGIQRLIYTQSFITF